MVIDVSGYNIVVVVIDEPEITVHVAVSNGMNASVVACDCFLFDCIEPPW